MIGHRHSRQNSHHIWRHLAVNEASGSSVEPRFVKYYPEALRPIVPNIPSPLSRIEHSILRIREDACTQPNTNPK
jgi:hypothetical protein